MEIKKEKTLDFLLALVFILIGVFLRILPHPPNFTPVAAIALFGGAYLSKRLSLLIPLFIMMVSDTFIGYYELQIMIVVYTSFLLTVLIGFWVKKRKSLGRIASASLISSLIFFLSTNLAVWIFSPWYTKNFEGLVSCFTLALPFFRNTLIGNMFYAFFFFEALELSKIIISRRQKQRISISKIKI